MLKEILIISPNEPVKDKTLFGQVAIAIGLLTNKQLAHAIRLKETTLSHRKLGFIFLRMNLIGRDHIQEILNAQKEMRKRVKMIAERKKPFQRKKPPKGLCPLCYEPKETASIICPNCFDEEQKELSAEAERMADYLQAKNNLLEQFKNIGDATIVKINLRPDKETKKRINFIDKFEGDYCYICRRRKKVSSLRRHICSSCRKKIFGKPQKQT